LEGEGRARIEKLTEFTGGQSFFPSSIHDLQDICFKLGVEIKNQRKSGRGFGRGRSSKFNLCG